MGESNQNKEQAKSLNLLISRSQSAPLSAKKLKNEFQNNTENKNNPLNKNSVTKLANLINPTGQRSGTQLNLKRTKIA